MKPFDELTRFSQLHRVRCLAEAALEAYGLNGARLSFLRYWANITYRVDLADSAMPKVQSGIYVPNRYLLRVLLTNHLEYAKGEMTWLAALSHKGGFPVPEPVPTLTGELVTRISTHGIPNGRLVSLMRWIDGRKLNGFRLHHFHALGQMVARLHKFAASWQPPEGFSRFIWDWEGLLGGRGFDHTVEELVFLMPKHLQEPFQFVSQQAQTVMEALGKGPDVYGMIHADLYPDNVLFKAGQAYPIDFEDCGFGYWMWDIAVALCQQPWTETWRQQRDAFLDGYTQLHTLPESQVQHLDLFIATQYATTVLWASLFMKNEPTRQKEHKAWRDKDGIMLLRYFER